MMRIFVHVTATSIYILEISCCACDRGGGGSSENFLTISCYYAYVCILYKKIRSEFQELRKFVTRPPVSTKGSFTSVFVTALYISTQFLTL
jgi:hypothetical protein